MKAKNSTLKNILEDLIINFNLEKQTCNRGRIESYQVQGRNYHLTYNKLNSTEELIFNNLILDMCFRSVKNGKYFFYSPKVRYLEGVKDLLSSTKTTLGKSLLKKLEGLKKELSKKFDELKQRESKLQGYKLSYEISDFSEAYQLIEEHILDS